MFLLTIILALNLSEQNCGFFVNDNSHQFYKNCSGFSHSKGTVMQYTFLESKNIGIFRDINFLMPDYELLQIKRVKLLKFFVAKTLEYSLTRWETDPISISVNRAQNHNKYNTFYWPRFYFRKYNTQYIKSSKQVNECTYFNN